MHTYLLLIKLLGFTSPPFTYLLPACLTFYLSLEAFHLFKKGNRCSIPTTYMNNFISKVVIRSTKWADGWWIIKVKPTNLNLHENELTFRRGKSFRSQKCRRKSLTLRMIDEVTANKSPFYQKEILGLGPNKFCRGIFKNAKTIKIFSLSYIYGL